MRACGGCARGHYSVGAPRPQPQPQAPDPSVDAQLELVLAVTTTLIFVASVSYVAFSAVYCCLRAGSSGSRQQTGGGGETWGQRPAAAVAEETRRALEEIPVVAVARDPAPAGGVGGAGAAEKPAAECCAVCLAEYAGGEEVRVLPACRHGFHRECVDRWLLTRAPTCPVCRAPVAAHAEGPAAKV